MGKTLEFTWEGVTEMQAKLAAIAKALPEELSRAVYEEAEIIKTESMRHTPWDTGALTGSHLVKQPEIQGMDVKVVISVGGPAVPYAVYVHENTEARHAPGTWAKFLEREILIALPNLPQRLVARIELERMI